VHWDAKFQSLVKDLTVKPKSLQARIISGSVILLSGSGLTTAINLAYNVAVARFLGPKGFGHATVVYTVLTLISAVTLSFQIISAKVVAQQPSPEGKSAVYRGFHRSAWIVGLIVAALLLVSRRAIADYLNLPDPILVTIMAVGAGFYVPLGARRGFIQGTFKFRRLATNLIIEGAFRLVGSVGLVLAGYGVEGVIAANSAAMAIAYFALSPTLSSKITNPLSFIHCFRETSHAMVFFAGQVLINNCDIVLVKHFFAARDAGLYAAVAMVGRVIFAFSNSVVNSMFPLVAGTREEERKDLRVIATSLVLVLGTGSALAIGLALAPAGIWTFFFGSGFQIAGKYNLPYLLALYAITTIVYSLSVVIITFEMSYKIANTSWVQLMFSGVVIAAICKYHSSLRQVILVQLVLMGALLICVALPFLMNSLTTPKRRVHVKALRPLRLIRRVPEDAVIAEFLRSDFHAPAFRAYKNLEPIVMHPNFDSKDENAKRRALFFIRHLALWKEVPADTDWFEMELDESDMGQIRVFPRAQWRKLARGNFAINEIVHAMRTRRELVDAPFLAKVSSIGERFAENDPAFSAVILIGLNESEPMTVLDGNHRLVASLLAPPGAFKKVRFLCGLSPRMTDCCWYNTNFVTLFHYGRNVLSNVFRSPESELARLLENTG
jgi:O-antigen/teichoic acid export membrane protein